MPVDTSNWIIAKTQTSPEKILSSQLRQFDVGSKEGRPRPFNYASAIDQYRGWIYAAVWLNAKAIAGTPLRLYVRKRSGDKLVNSRSLKRTNPIQYVYLSGRHKRHRPSKYVLQKAVEWGEDFEEITENHPILDLLAKPNPYTLGFEFSCMRHMWGSLTGNTYMHPVVESAVAVGQRLNRVKELWFMPSQFVKIVMGDPKKDELIAGYQFGIDRTVQKFFPPDEVFHMKFPNPRDQWYGLGQVEADWDAQKLTIAQRETDQARYDNLSRPDLAVVTESSNVTTEQLQEMQNEWARLFRGTFRQGNPVFLTGKTQVIPLNWQPSEQGSREIVIEEHAAVFGVPVSMLKANDPNLASAQVGFASWRENTILPYCRMDEEFLNNVLMPVYGIEDDCFLAYDNPVPENRDEIRQDITAYFGKVWTPNECRTKLGDDPIEEENADKLLMEGTMTPIDKVGELPDLGMGMGGFGDKPKKPSDKITKQSDELYTKAHDAREGEPEQPIVGMMRSLGEVFDKQRKAVMALLTGQKEARIDVSIHEIYELLRGFDDDVRWAIEGFVQDQLVSGGQYGMEEIGLPPETFDISNEKVANWARQYTVKLAHHVNDFTASKLSDELSHGYAAGESASKLSERVGKVFDEFDGYRTEMIARTESARAYVAGTEAAWRESGIVTGKKWKLAPGGCEACGAIARKFMDRAIPLNQPFMPLGSALDLGNGKVFKIDYTDVMGPPLHPHCRCGITSVLAEN
jgi:HK97 family phage portal protein